MLVYWCNCVVLKRLQFSLLFQLFLLQCNLRFRSYSSFNEYRDIISVALASLYPLKDEQLYHAVCSALRPNELSWLYFKQQMELLDGLLVQNTTTGGRAFFHPLFREWLMGLVLPTQGNGTCKCYQFFYLRLMAQILFAIFSNKVNNTKHK